MSKISRKAAIIAVSLIVVLAGAGAASYFLFVKDKGIAVEVNGVKITETELQKEISKTKSQYEAQGTTIQPEQMASIRASVLDNLIIREILKQKSESYAVNDKEVDNQIASVRNRYDSEDAYKKALSEQGYDADSFRTAVIEDIKIRELIKEKVPQTATVGDEEIQKFYDDNPSYFTQPEKIQASHILVKVDKSATDEEKAKARKKIERIAEDLKNGADFAEEAKKESEGPSAPKGGDLGEFSKGQMVAPFEEAAFALKVGEVSGIVETQFGYHIIKVFKKTPESHVALEDVKASIQSYLLQNKNQSLLNDYLDSLKSNAKIRYYQEKDTQNT